MTKIGYAAMLEQFHPNHLLDWAEQAEAAGFTAGFQVSEHFHPWTPQQGQSAFAWSFMGALGQRTSLRFGTAVTCPGFRYHPAVIAHAAATLGAMYPGRFWLGLGAGEALNEHVVGLGSGTTRTLEEYLVALRALVHAHAERDGMSLAELARLLAEAFVHVAANQVRRL